MTFSRIQSYLTANARLGHRPPNAQPHVPTNHVSEDLVDNFVVIYICLVIFFFPLKSKIQKINTLN